MRLIVSAVAVLLSMAATAHATQLSYIDNGQVWVSTLDGAQKRAISGPAPVVTPGEGRSWTEQTQSDDGWIFGVARVPSQSGAASPTRLWNPAGAVAAQSSLGYHAAYLGGTLAVPVQLSLVPGGGQVTYTYSSLLYGFPNSTLYVGTWVENTSNSSGEPFDIPDLIGSSLVGSRWVGVNDKAGSGDSNIVFESAGDQAPFGTIFTPWFHATGAEAVDASATGGVVAVIYRLSSNGPAALGLFQSGGSLGSALTGSCDVPAVGSVHSVSVAADGASLAWVDDRGLVTAPMPSLTTSSPCPIAAPAVISATGSYPSLGATTLATATAGGSTPGGGTTPAGQTPGGSTTPVAQAPGGSTTTAASNLQLAKSVKASAFAKGVPVTITVTGKGAVSAIAKVGKTTLAKTSAKAKKAGKVKLTLTAKKPASKLRSYKGKTLTITVTWPGGTATITRTLG